MGQARRLQKLGIHSFDKELNALSSKLDELRDWQQFATSPKREELIAKLQSLVDQPIEANAQGEALKSARKEWNELGPPSRGQQPLQKQFDKLAEQAFSVCKPHYAQQSAARAENLTKRRGLCEQIRTYLAETDWASADMRAAENIMRTAREEWRRYHPCDRRALKSVEADFEALQDELYGHVKENWDKNVAAKEAIVAQAEALAAEDDARAQVDKAKQLQQQWRNIGTTPRGPDQRLWRKFRQACDKIFAKLDEQRDAQSAALREQQQEFDALLEAFDADAGEIAAQETELENIAEKGRQLRMSGEQRSQINAHQAALKNRRQTKQKNRQAERLQQWFDWDVAVSKAEQSAESITAPHSLFTPRLKGKADSEDLHKLTLEAEMAANLSSPAEDQQLRLVLQVELINSGRSNLQLVQNQDFIDRWCRSGPKSEANDELRERFFNALRRRLSTH